METQTVEQVTSRIEEAMRGARRPVIVTDADGTLWTGDVGDDTFDALVDQRAVRHEARDALSQEARLAGLSGEGDANAIAARIHEAYRKGTFPEVRCYELMSWTFAGYRVEEAHAFVDEVQRATHLDTRLHAEMSALITWAGTCGVEVWIVSASPSLVVERGARQLEIPAHRIVAAEAEVRGGVVAAGLAAPLPYGASKVTAMERAIGEAEIVAAFGDNAFDFEMLCRAAVPVAVRPKDRLRERRDDLPRMVELAPR